MTDGHHQVWLQLIGALLLVYFARVLVVAVLIAAQRHWLLWVQGVVAFVLAAAVELALRLRLGSVPAEPLLILFAAGLFWLVFDALFGVNRLARFADA